MPSNLCFASLLDLLPQTPAILGFAHSADFESHRAGFGILQQPVRKLASLKPTTHDPASGHPNKSERDGLCGILCDPMPIQLVPIFRIGYFPVQSRIAGLFVEQSFQRDPGAMSVTLQPHSRSVSIFNGRGVGQ